MRHNDVIKLSNELRQSLEKMDMIYREYIKSVKESRQLAEKLQDAAKDLINKPYINIEDFEIDN